MHGPCFVFRSAGSCAGDGGRPRGGDKRGSGSKPPRQARLPEDPSTTEFRAHSCAPLRTRTPGEARDNVALLC